MRILLSISPKFARTVALILTLVVLFLTLVSVLGLFLSFYLDRRLPGHPLSLVVGELHRAFELNSEKSFPTLYSADALLLCSVLLAIIAIARRTSGARYVRHWAVLSVVFLYLSADEVLVIHEKLIAPLRSAFDTSGFLYQAWVIPGIIFVLVFALAYWRFVFDLPARIRYLFLTAGVLYVWGVLGMEMVSGYFLTTFGRTMVQRLTTNAEELLEMMGVVVFIYALLLYLSLHVEELVLSPSPESESPGSGAGPLGAGGGG